LDRVSGAPSFADAYTRYYDPMIRLALVTTDSLPAAEDIVQDAFVELYRRWANVVDPGAWLRRVVTNRSTSWLRRHIVARRYAQRGQPAAEQPPPAPEDTAVRRALLQLRPRHRAAVFLR